MTFRTHFFYWILPTVLIGSMILLYFLDIPAITEILAPEANRELGLLETLQHLTLLVVIVIAWMGAKRAPELLPKLGFIAIMLVTVFLLLEELNYGQHYWTALREGMTKHEEGASLSFHNLPGNTQRFKLAGDIVIGVFFVLLPLLASKRGPAWFRFFIAPRGMIATVVAMFLLSKFAHYLNDLQQVKGTLGSSMAEFRELFTYYLGLLYVHELAMRRKWPGFRSQVTHPD